MTDTYHASTWFVSGATGLVGSAIVRLLCEYEFNVIGLARETSNPEIIEELKKLGAKIIIGDILDPVSFENYFAVIDIVVHTAAIVRSDDPSMYWETNVNGTNNLIDLCKSYGVKRFIHISSAGVYGRVKTSDINEDHKKQPQSEYSISKLKSEELLIECIDELDITILRPPFIFGKYDRYVAQNSYKLFSRRLIPKLLFHDPLIGFTHVDDIAHLVVTVGGRERTPNIVYNIQSFSLNYTELVKIVHRATNKTGYFLHIPYSFVRLLALPIDFLLGLSNSKFRLNNVIKRLKYDWVLSTERLRKDYSWESLHSDVNELELYFSNYFENVESNVNKDD